MSTYVYNPDDELINNFENRTVRRSKRLAVEHPEGEARRKALGDISNMMEIGSAKPDKLSNVVKPNNAIHYNGMTDQHHQHHELIHHHQSHLQHTNSKPMTRSQAPFERPGKENQQPHPSMGTICREQEMKDPAMLNHSIADMDGFDSDDVETSDEGSDDSNIDHQRMHNNTNLINNDWAHSLSAAPPTPPSPELEYADDVYVCLRHNEIKYRPRLDYMDVVQGDINHTMRGILVDWLVEVAEEYKLTQQTLHLTINYIDRLLSLVPVNRTKLQLVGITAMLVASKYEEIYPPSIDEFVYISDNTYTRDEVLRMESVLLTTLSFCLTCSTPWEFSRRFYMHTKIDKRTKALSDFLIEGFLQEPVYIHFLPSIISASAIFLAYYTTKQVPWPQVMQDSSGFALTDLSECLHALHSSYIKICSTESSLKAVRDKYAQDKFHRVSSITPPPLIKYV